MLHYSNRAVQLMFGAVIFAVESAAAIAAALVPLMVVLVVSTVVLRYLYGVSVPALQEAIVYAFAMVMTLACGAALLRDEHVRVDLLYRTAPDRVRALIDTLGIVLFLGPFLLFLWQRSQPYVERSWRLREGSLELAGLPFLYLLKSLILVFVVLMALSALATLLRRLLTMLTVEPGPR